MELNADLIVNRVSAASPQVQDFSLRGEVSEFANMFLALDRVFPNGARGADLLRGYRPRPGLPLTYVRMRNWSGFTGQARVLGMEAQAEVHGYYRGQADIASRVDRAYDFAPPPLVLHTLFRKDAGAAARAPENRTARHLYRSAPVSGEPARLRLKQSAP